MRPAPDRTRARGRRTNGAFTLLEVMAAVAVVAIVFTTLARVASQGLQSEGTSQRRLQASLLADAVLADIEDEIAAGATPELGSSEEEEEQFTVLVDVTPFDLAGLIPEAEGDGVDPQSAPEGFSLGGIGPTGESQTALRQVEIYVVWNEGLNEQTVSRITYGLDQAAIQGALSAAVDSLSALNPAAGPAVGTPQ